MMKRLVSTVNLPKEEWLRYRKTGLTGTDAGAITGMNPYVSAFQIYQDKITEEITESDSERMRQGRDLEAYVAKRFEEETGLKVRNANAIYQNEAHPIMLADFDRLIIGQKAGLECKTVSPYAGEQWKDEKIPLHYQLQVQHYLAVSGFDCWYVAALILGQEFLIRKIVRDEELIKDLITIEERFWNENVVKRIMPEPDGSKNCYEQIAKMYFCSDREKTIELCGFDSDLKRREELTELIDRLEKEKASIDQKVQLELQEAAYGVTPNYRISWVMAESKRLDNKKLKAENPDLYEQYCKVSGSRRFIVKHVA